MSHSTDEALPVIFRGHTHPGFWAHGLGVGRSAFPLTLLAGNSRPLAGHYLCLIPLRDFPRLDPGFARQHDNWHFSDLEPEIVADVREGRALLMFDLSNEGPAFYPPLFEHVFRWLQAEQLPSRRCLWLAQNRAMSAAFEEYFGDSQPVMECWYSDFFVKIAAYALTPGHADSVLPEDVGEYMSALFSAWHKDRLLLCLNATPRIHRLLALAGLRDAGLLDRSLVSFPGLQYCKPGASTDEVDRYLRDRPSLQSLRPHLDWLCAQPPIRADVFSEEGNALVTKLDLDAYRRTSMSLVTESDFGAGAVDRITEKSVKAFGVGHPSLILGSPHSLKYLSNLGFQRWTMFDESYDSIEDPTERFQLLMSEIRRQCALLDHAPFEWLAAASEVGRFNLQHAHSGALLRTLLKQEDAQLVAVRRRLYGD